MKIEDLKTKPYGEICAACAEVGPQVLDAKARYDALAAEHRMYTTARELIGHGIWIGDRVQLRGRWAGKQDPIALVCGVSLGDIQFQVLRKDGQYHGEPIGAFMFEGWEKTD